MTNGRDTRGRGKINIPGGMEQDGARFPHATQNYVQFKTYGLFVSGISHLIFFDCDWLQVTDTVGSKSKAGGGQLYNVPLFIGCEIRKEWF